MADKKKKMNVFQRIAQLFKDVRTELKRVVWPSKEKLKNTCAVVLVVIVFFAIYLSIINNGGHWVLEKIGFYKNTPIATTTEATEIPVAETTLATEASEETSEETATEETTEATEADETEESEDEETEETEETEESEEDN
jgi:preprotein translocase subunit SecE